MYVAYKFEVCSNTCEYEAGAFWCHKIIPFLLVLGICKLSKLSGPVDTTRLGESVINDIVDMSFTTLVI